MTLPARLWQTLSRHRLLPESGPLIVAVSGGPDSLALLHALHALADRLPCPLHVATLDHGLRGEEGASDARFVVEICQRWNVPVTAGQVNVANLARHQRLGIETGARLARYRFLASVARAQGATHVAVAHNANDQAETVLMNILRGAGLKGLRAMAPAAPLPGDPSLTLIRPLLFITRDEIESYVVSHDLQPRFDVTNLDTTLLRNRIRHQILPQLRELNPQVVRLLGQLAALAATEDDYMDRAAREALAALQPEVSEQGVSLSRSAFRALHPALQRRVLAWAARQLAGDSSGDIGFTHLLAAADVAGSARTGARALLPGGLQLRVDYDRLRVEPQGAPLVEQPPFAIPPDVEIDVAIPGVTLLPGGVALEVRVEPKPEPPRARLALPENSHVTLRARHRGDRFAPLGMQGHTRNLADWMIDRRIPRHQRDHIPLLVVNTQIAAILFGDEWPISDSFAVRPSSGRVVYIYTVTPP